MLTEARQLEAPARSYSISTRPPSAKVTFRQTSTLQQIGFIVGWEPSEDFGVAWYPIFTGCSNVSRWTIWSHRESLFSEMINWKRKSSVGNSTRSLTAWHTIGWVHALQEAKSTRRFATYTCDCCFNTRRHPSKRKSSHTLRMRPCLSTDLSLNAYRYLCSGRSVVSYIGL